MFYCKNYGKNVQYFVSFNKLPMFFGFRVAITIILSYAENIFKTTQNVVFKPFM